MSVTNLGRIIGSSISVSLEQAEGSNTKRQVQEYNVIYMIQLDDPCADEYNIGNAPGLPVVGSEHPDLPGFYCMSREFSETDEPTLWTCSVVFSTKVGDASTSKKDTPGNNGQGGDPDQDGGFEDPGLPTPVDTTNPDAAPWTQDAEVSITTTYVTRTNKYAFGISSISGPGGSTAVPQVVNSPNPGTAKGTTFPWLDASYCKNVKIDGSGGAGEYITLSPMTNSAGEPVWVEHDFPAYNIEIKRAILPEKASAIQPHLIGTLNMDAINITWPYPIFIPALAAKYKDCSVQTQVHDDGTKYLIYTQSIEVLPHTGGHRIPLVDQGSFSFSGGRTTSSTAAQRVWAVDAEGNPMVTNLNGAGDVALDAATAWWTIDRPVRNFEFLFKQADMI